MNNDLVSIIMPSHNTAKFIGDSIRSVLAQTYRNWELIVVDDASNDGTENVVEEFVTADSRIRYFKNESNRGAAYSRNRALREANGRWIAFLDSDDLWSPAKLERQIQFMKERDLAFSYTVYEEIDENGARNGILVSGPRKIPRGGFWSYCWAGCLTVMYDAKTLGTIQIHEIAKNNDYAMWLKITDRAACELLPSNLAQYRRNRAGSISNHSVATMMKWHYKLFRNAEGQSAPRAAFNTIRNVVFGVWKKMRYVKRLNVRDKKTSDKY